jgi:hypothetical protein
MRILLEPLVELLDRISLHIGDDDGSWNWQTSQTTLNKLVEIPRALLFSLENG